jgi:hypothetical protein
MVMKKQNTKGGKITMMTKGGSVKKINMMTKGGSVKKYK